MSKILSLENVSLVRQGKALLQEISWQVQPGETWAILGLNGAGKSTLLRLLMAEHWPSDGQLAVLGTDFGQGNIPELRKQIGVVGSFIAERFPSRLLAEEIVLTGRYKSSILYAPYSQAELDEARLMLQQLGASALIGRTYISLSQGERQTLLIARSLMDQPALLIFDEATSGLDLFARERLLTQVGQILQQEEPPTVLYVTHHAEEITAQMSHVLLLKEGRVVAKGPKEEILTPSILSEFYGLPVQVIPLGEERVFIKPIPEEEVHA